METLYAICGNSSGPGPVVINKNSINDVLFEEKRQEKFRWMMDKLQIMQFLCVKTV